MPAKISGIPKWAIHPSQIPLANEVFTPDPHLVQKTHRSIAAMKEAAASGKGAVSLDGRLIDAASIRMAETLLAKLEQIEARDQHDRAGATALRHSVAAG
jgi:malyl-CoA/(S)-citramalyl-CoA lyase